jgi:hypothetical protein
MTPRRAIPLPVGRARPDRRARPVHRARADRRARPVRRALTAYAVLAALLATAAPLRAQDANFNLPPLELARHTFRIADWRGARMPEDRTQRVLLEFEDSAVMLVQWANAAPGASTFNNEPRFEAAAYEIQKLFLDEDEFVVPPTVLRAFPLDYVSAQMPGVRRTFDGAESVLVVLQYWLSMVTPDNFWDPRRADQDTVYARHVGNFNALTYLIRHHDSNVGNFLISEYEPSPRVFSVDNGVAFSAPPSNRGTEWRNLRVRRLPRHTIERLRAITREDLDRALATLVEFEVQDGQLVAVTPGENISPGRGVRRSGNRIQLGLTRPEINAIESRLRNLLNQVDRGRINPL